MENTCHICKEKIFNGIPLGEDTTDFINMMKTKGFKLGYDSTTTGCYGNMREVPIKPICGDCKSKKSKAEKVKEINKVMRKVIPTLKKEFVCQCCANTMYEYADIFTTDDKQKLINHMRESHTVSDLEYIVSRNADVAK